MFLFVFIQVIFILFCLLFTFHEMEFNISGLHTGIFPYSHFKLFLCVIIFILGVCLLVP